MSSIHLRRPMIGALLVASSVVLGACGGGAASQANGRVSDASRFRRELESKDVAKLAPQAFAEANDALKRAEEAQKQGDSTGAELHAERAIAAYQRAIALARLARATEDEANARSALARATELGERYSAARAAAEREADDLEKQLKIARETQAPAPSGPADPEREKARLVAARALATQARLLCSAARLVSPQAPGLVEAEKTAGDLEKKLEASPKPAPIDSAARARAGCLASLAKARRAGGTEGDAADSLLSDLSRSAAPGGKSTTDLAPTRDERGVTVTLRKIFKGDGLTPEGETTLKDLGRVAAAHPTFAVQVVVHDAQAPSPAETASNNKRADAISAALAAGGAAKDKLKVEQAGARAPVVDPNDATRRERNARVEVVFVASGSGA